MNKVFLSSTKLFKDYVYCISCSFSFGLLKSKNERCFDCVVLRTKLAVGVDIWRRRRRMATILGEYLNVHELYERKSKKR